MKPVIYAQICACRMGNLTKFSRAREVPEPAHIFSVYKDLVSIV